jgi:predicted transposase/invertase (TIGR01784 family)
MAVQLSKEYLEWERVTREQGRIEGKLEGKIEGKLEGKIEGKLEGKIEAVPALVERGFSVEEIAQILGLTIEQVQSSTAESRAGESENGSAT